MSTYIEIEPPKYRRVRIRRRDLEYIPFGKVVRVIKNNSVHCPLFPVIEYWKWKPNSECKKYTTGLIFKWFMWDLLIDLNLKTL